MTRPLVKSLKEEMGRVLRDCSFDEVKEIARFADQQMRACDSQRHIRVGPVPWHIELSLGGILARAESWCKRVARLDIIRDYPRILYHLESTEEKTAGFDRVYSAVSEPGEFFVVSASSHLPTGKSYNLTILAKVARYGSFNIADTEQSMVSTRLLMVQHAIIPMEKEKDEVIERYPELAPARDDRQLLIMASLRAAGFGG